MDCQSEAWILFYARLGQRHIKVKFLAVVLWVLGAMGCASQPKVILKNQNVGLGDLKKAIVSVIGEPRQVSENERSLYSVYFPRQPDESFHAEKSKERLYAVFVILGERRPYSVQVRVVSEAKRGSQYVQIQEEPTMASRLARELKQKLHQGLDNRNVIDDFRAF